MKIRPLLLMAAFAALTVSASAEEIKVGGGGAPIDNIFRPVRESFEKSTGNKMNIVFTNATLAFKQLDAGEIDVSTAGQSFDDLLASLKKEGYAVKDPAAFKAVTIGKGKIFVVLNKDNKVAKLTGDQVKGIFTGKITNWNEVGGPDAPIIVVTSNQNPATMSAFKKLALEDQPYTKDVIEAAKFEDIRSVIASNPEAVGFGPGSMLDPTVKAADTPDYSRPIIAVTKGPASAKVQKLLDFIAGDGKKLVKN